MIKFSGELTLAVKACERFEALGYRSDRTTMLMDLTAADGCNGNMRIDWLKLLDAPAMDFVHDVAGIQRHINRETGRIEDCFVPRCVAHEGA